jgi:hypothetical protein
VATLLNALHVDSNCAFASSILTHHLIAIEDKGIITNYELLRSKVGTADWIVVGAYHYACMI